MQEKKKTKGRWRLSCSCEWAEYGTYVALFISRDIEMYTVWNWNKRINVLSQQFFSMSPYAQFLRGISKLSQAKCE